MTKGTLPQKKQLFVPLIGALALAFGLVSGVSASQHPAPLPENSLPQEASPHAGTSLHVLQKLIAAPFIPDGAVVSINRIINEQIELREPGALCRRILANPHSPEPYVERCLAAFADDEAGRPFPPGLVCRRVAANAGNAPAELIERCREWVASQADRPDGAISPHEACRRIVNADDPVAELVERCRAWLESTTSNGMPISELCRRVLDSDEPDGGLLERCRTWLASTTSQGMPVLEACRRALTSDHTDEALIERCEALLEARPQRPEGRPEQRPELRPQDRTTITPQRTAPAGTE